MYKESKTHNFFSYGLMMFISRLVRFFIEDPIFVPVVINEATLIKNNDIQNSKKIHISLINDLNEEDKGIFYNQK